MKKNNILFKIIWRSSRKDILLSAPWLPLYSLSEVVLAICVAILLQLVFIQQKIVAVRDLIPGKLKTHINLDYTIARQDLIFIVPILLVLTALVKLLSGFMSSYLLERAGHAVSHKLRESMLIGFLSSPGNKIDHRNPDYIANQLMQDTTLLQGAISKGTISAARDVLVLFGIVVAMLLISWQTFIIGIAVILPISFALRKITERLNYYSREGQKKQIDISTRLLSSHNGLLTVNVLRSHQREKIDFEKLNDDNYKFMRQSLFVRTFFPPATEFFAVIVLALIYMWRLSYVGDFPASTYASMLILLGFSFRYIKNIANTISFFSDLGVVFKRIKEYLEDHYHLDTYRRPKDLPSYSKEAIIASHVSYVTKDSKVILSDCSISIKKGLKIAFIGESGAGKTTFLRIIAGLVFPTSGDIARSSDFLLASQMPYVYRGTVQENIIYANEDFAAQIRDDKCKDLVLALGLAHSEIGSQICLSKSLGFLGEGLSGGEKARVALARILFSNPKMILLDEPTANLDAVSSKLFWQAIDSWKNKDSENTVIAVSHVISEVQNFDYFYLFEDGKITKSGTAKEMFP